MIEKLKNNKKIIIISLIIILLIILIYNRITLLDRVVNKNKSTWNYFEVQNTILTGDYMGFIYDNDTILSELSEEYLTVLAIESSDEVHDDENFNYDTYRYEYRVKISDFNESLEKKFGFSFDLVEMSFGCGDSISIDGDYYEIYAADFESCDIDYQNMSYYYTYIDDYYKSGDEIIINYKVGYILPISVYDEEYEDYFVTSYEVYDNKNKDNLLISDFDDTCLNEENDECFTEFTNYKVILKRNWFHYYLYSILKA